MNCSTAINNRHGRSIIRLQRYKNTPGIAAIAGRIERFKAHNISSTEFALKAVLSRVNATLRPEATEQELVATLDSGIILQAIRHKIQEQRNPGGYFSKTGTDNAVQ